MTYEIKYENGATNAIMIAVGLDLLDTLPSNPERTAGLRKLLEAKDCAVRAELFK